MKNVSEYKVYLCINSNNEEVCEGKYLHRVLQKQQGSLPSFEKK